MNSLTASRSRIREDLQWSRARATDMLSASITARGEEEPAWSSSDEMLSNKLYSLLTHKNEKFMENFDDREYDYLAQLTDAQGEEPPVLPLGQL